MHMALPTSPKQIPMQRILYWEISEALLHLNGRSAEEIFGYPDNLKLSSCMTLFARTDNAHPVFGEVLEKYFKGIPDERTLKMLEIS